MRARIALVQTGGTIDKDYPRSTLGYAFEIDEPATERIIADAAHVPLSVDFDCRTVCRKDSTEITDADREDIVELCSSISADKIVVSRPMQTQVHDAKATLTSVIESGDARD
jgi:L-asparaginase